LLPPQPVAGQPQFPGVPEHATEPGDTANWSCQPLFADPFTHVCTSVVTLNVAVPAAPPTSPAANTAGAVVTRPPTAPKLPLAIPAQPPLSLLSPQAVPIRETVMLPPLWQLEHPV
jgi:hypothetical protein